MKLFEFSLQRLFDAREAVEKSLEIKLGHSLNKVEVCKRKIEYTDARIREGHREMEKWNGRPVDPQELALHVKYAHWLDQERARQEAELRQRQKEADEVRREWMAAMKERKVLERLREKERQEWLVDENRKEQKAVDELTSAMFFRRRQQA